MNIADLRAHYTKGGLLESDCDTDPLVQFKKWFNDALKAEVIEPNAMTLSTVQTSGIPKARIVLLKGVDERGFVFYTNYESAKGQEMQERPFAALTFWWPELERQIRIEGNVEKVPHAESDEYFESRPFGSKVGAWVSEQSTIIQGRSVIEERLAELEVRFADGLVTRPPHWGGYLIKPTLLEFWQGRPSRLHDRIRYRKVEADWKIERLSP
ncbi:MAG TPA: pyridoxamine 5'-phosphate oxidase [Bacteroidetes bacterium]|nr:pyridoxamine 5'-phosphate oxidase [Bacteroidota bacterium]HRR09012.1 pyridoxamine 5'-phosphate oxidase [Rhodothermales bacterium]